MKTSRTPPATPPADPPAPAILTADELAKILRVNRKTIYEAVQRDEIPGVLRIGRTLRFVRDQVLPWTRQGRVISDPKGPSR